MIKQKPKVMTNDHRKNRRKLSPCQKCRMTRGENCTETSDKATQIKEKDVIKTLTPIPTRVFMAPGRIEKIFSEVLVSSPKASQNQTSRDKTKVEIKSQIR